MLLELKRQTTVGKNDALLGLCVAVGCGLFLDILMLILTAAFGDISAFPPLGSIGVTFGASLLALIISINTIGIRFNMALKMGAVRKHYIPVCALLCFGFSFVGMLAGRLWVFLDAALLRIMGVTLFPFVLSFPVMLLVSLGVTIVGCWIGALLMRYGRKGFWVMWGICMFISLFGSQVGTVFTTERQDFFAHTVRAIVAFFASWPISGVWVVAFVLALAMVAHTWGILRRVRAYD
jgi:hypothetical protein